MNGKIDIILPWVDEISTNKGFKNIITLPSILE